MSIISAIVIFVGLCVGFLIYQSVSLKRKLLNAFNSTFDTATDKPTYLLSWSYGRPSFTITFNSEEDLERAKAEGLTNVFSEKIQNLCRSFGGKTNPFEAELAICYTSKK